MKKILALMAVTAAFATSGNGFAHENKAKHGGVVSSTKDDISVELASKDGKAVIYVEDHGKPVPTVGATGKLTVLNGAEKTEIALEPSGENSLTAKGDAKLIKGTKAVATVTLADKKALNVRFAIK